MERGLRSGLSVCVALCMVKGQHALIRRLPWRLWSAQWSGRPSSPFGVTRRSERVAHSPRAALALPARWHGFPEIPAPVCQSPCFGDTSSLPHICRGKVCFPGLAPAGGRTLRAVVLTSPEPALAALLVGPVRLPPAAACTWGAGSSLVHRAGRSGCWG